MACAACQIRPSGNEMIGTTGALVGFAHKTFFSGASGLRSSEYVEYMYTEYLSHLTALLVQTWLLTWPSPLVPLETGFGAFCNQLTNGLISKYTI